MRGYEEYPYRGQGLGLALPGFLLRPLPGSALVGLASPGGFGSGSVRLWRSPPGALGVPSVCFAPSSFPHFRVAPTLGIAGLLGLSCADVGIHIGSRLVE